MIPSDSVLPAPSKLSSSARTARPRSRAEAMERPALISRDEALVVDERSSLRPAQVVETKLTRILKDASLPVSHLQMRGMLRSR
ncbi:hypothetical protein OJF2_74830 [Aquisphaera giovannonii]|uniref:Uncharacterized protein n=1 Tax=Aquisphaera giovannonii TaxID=406548 RepID=A0A5B9WEH4_9BACT|nr:hypothetical protein [Aquisphaera giovannonii]QEH38873.1 hypothetical protein OJF2_74830 [Aquisphaera giovannonii]